jgi:surface antigen
MFRNPFLSLLLLSVALSACQTTNASATAAIQAHQPGILLAGWADADTLAALTAPDKTMDRQAENRAFVAPVAQQITWHNPDSGVAGGHAGTITATREFYAPNGTYCREFLQTLTLGGQKLQGRDKACQKPDGSWNIAQ